MSEQNGPQVRVVMSCSGCQHVRTARYVAQGDSGCDVSCAHPSIGSRDVGDTTWSTPDWCPVRPSDALSTARQEAEALRAENERLRDQCERWSKFHDESLAAGIAEHDTLRASLEQVTGEANEWHEMLRDVLAACGATTVRDILGPDAPLRAVRKAIADRDRLAREVEVMRPVVEAAKEWLYKEDRCSQDDERLEDAIGKALWTPSEETLQPFREALDKLTRSGR